MENKPYPPYQLRYESGYNIQMINMKATIYMFSLKKILTIIEIIISKFNLYMIEIYRNLYIICIYFCFEWTKFTHVAL